MGNALVNKLGIQSWCFRGLNGTRAIIDALKESGVDGVELTGLHIDLNDPAARDATMKEYADADIRITSFGVFGFGEDETANRPVFEFAKAAGFNAISADLATDAAIPIVEKLCDEYGVKIAIHNHGRKHRLGPVYALKDLFAKTTPNIGLCLDTAWMLDSRENPVDVADMFRDRLYGLHVKDFVFDRAGNPEDVVVGTGNLELDRLTAFLTDSNFDGYLTLEYEGDVDNPVPATKKCVDVIRESFARL